MELNGRHYFVGKLASLESRTCSYAFEKTGLNMKTPVLLATAVALLMNQEEESISIAVGLPFSDYIQQGKRFQEYLYNFDETVKLYDRNRPRLRRSASQSHFIPAIGWSHLRAGRKVQFRPPAW